MSGSRRHADPATYLVPEHVWEKERADSYSLLGLTPDPNGRLQLMRAEFRDGMGRLDKALALGRDVRVEQGRLVVTPVEAEDGPEGLGALEKQVHDRLPRVSLADILVEVDTWCHYLDCLTHARGATTRSPDLDLYRLAAVLALATNIGLGPWQTRPSCLTNAWPGRPSGTCAPTPWKRPPQRSSATNWGSPSPPPGGT